MGDHVLKNFLILKGKIDPPPAPKTKTQAKKEKDKPVEQIIEDQATLKSIIEDKPKLKVVRNYLQELTDKLNKEFLDDD